MLRLVILCMIGYSQDVMAMNENPCSEIPYESFQNVGEYLYKTGCQQLHDYADPNIMFAIVDRNYNISQEQIEVMRHGLNDYDNPEIRAIIVANNYQISQKKIDIIKNAVKSAIIYYDVEGDFVMVARGDNKVINSHSKVQRYTTRKKCGSKILVPYDLENMPVLLENDSDEEEDHNRSAFAFSSDQVNFNDQDEDDGTL